MKIPTEKECLKLLEEFNPSMVSHSVFVKELALKIADIAEERGITVNRDLLIAGALLHDIKKRFDIHPDGHNIEARKMLTELGYPEVGLVAEKHFFEQERNNWEQKIVFLADMSQNPGNKIVSPEERLDYIKRKYGIPEGKYEIWLKDILNVKEEILGDGKRLL